MTAKLSDEERIARRKASKARWLIKNPGYLAEYKRRDRKANPEKWRERGRKEYHNNKEGARETHKKWVQSNQEYNRDRLERRKYKNPDLYALKILAIQQGLAKDRVPQELVRAKVEQLKVIWLIKGVSHEVIERYQSGHE